MPVHIHDITFGIEIECFVPEGSNAMQAASAISARIGAGRCQASTYTHQVSTNWKIVTDGSLGDFQRGIEVVSPVLSGAAGIDEAEKVIKALQDFGCSVNKKCGLHVHVGVGSAAFRAEGENVPLAFMKRFSKMYAVFEPVIDSLVPPSRRASANAFCRSITSASLTRLDSAATLEDIIYAITGARDSNYRRYHKLNLVAFARYKTVEVRHHSGTLDSNKVRNWIVLCLRMAAAAANGAEVIMASAAPAARRPAAPTVPAAPAAAPAPTQVPVNRAREGSASWRIGQMMLRPEGVTGPEAREAVGWPSVSMPQQAQICGLQYTTQRTGRTVRYFARTAQAEMAAAAASPAPAPAPAPEPTPAAPAPTPTPITLLGLMDLIGCEMSEREFFLQRQADLGGPIQWAA